MSLDQIGWMRIVYERLAASKGVTLETFIARIEEARALFRANVSLEAATQKLEAVF